MSPHCAPFCICPEYSSFLTLQVTPEVPAKNLHNVHNSVPSSDRYPCHQPTLQVSVYLILYVFLHYIASVKQLLQYQRMQQSSII